MSYSTELKKKLLNSKTKSNCCRRAFAFGIMFGSAMSHPEKADAAGKVFLLSSGDISLAECVGDFLSRFYKADCNIVSKTNYGRFDHSVYTSSSVARAMSEKALETPSLNACEYFKCDQCRSFFARGVFVAAAALAEPTKQYHLEFLSENAKLAGVFREFLEEIGIPPSGKTRIYYKNAEKVRLLLAYIGAKSESFDVVNITIARQIRNEENRITNCEAKNIQRSISASMQQLDAITYILSENALEELPEELQITAKLRLENPDMSLSELAKLHDPSITKSGLTHRLAKISAFSQHLKDERSKDANQ